MRLFVRALLVMVCSLACASAASIKLDTLKVGSRTYKNVVVTGATASDIYFSHDEGVSSAKLKYLEPDLQKRFNYDAKAAAEFERQQSQNDAAYQATLASNIARQVAAQVQATKTAAVLEALSDPLSDKSLLGKAAPAFSFTEWSSGKKPSLEGKYVLAYFWSPASAASRRAMAEVNALQKKFTNNFAVIGIAPKFQAGDESTDAKPEFPTGIDAKSAFAAVVGVTSVPQVILLDPKGTVLYQGHPAAITEARLQKILAPKTE